MSRFAKPIATVAVVTIAIWLIGEMIGFEFALIPSLALSVLLTALLNAGAIRKALSSGSSERSF